jgi:diacylglycerol kinase (ATP)
MLPIVVIENPCAGSRVGHDRFERCSKVLRSGGADVELWRTEAPGHAIELASAASDRLVVAAGGDGTVNEVINGLAEDATLGIVPLGTANVLARELRLPQKIGAACQRVLEGKAYSMDLGVATDRAGESRRFACMAGMGADARALALAASLSSTKGRLGQLAYPTATLRSFFREGLPRINLLACDGQAWTSRYAAVCNTRLFYGSHSLARNACIGDGLLDLCLVRGARIVTILGLTVRFFADLPLGKHVAYEAVREVAAESRDEVPVHLDAEVWGKLPMKFGVEPKALKVVR